MRKIITSAIVISLFSVSAAEASLAVTSPSSVCVLLNNIGLATGSWKNIYDNEFGCNSPYKEIGSGFPLANNLAYYVDGNRNAVSQAKLVLNVNNKSQAKSAHSALLNASEALSTKIAGTKLPQTVKDAISGGKSMKTKIGQTAVEVKRDNWPTGKGYEIHVVFK
jgi:hypothetical protein